MALYDCADDKCVRAFASLHGIDVSAVKCSVGAGGARGLFASRALRRGEVILRVPVALFMTGDAALHRVAEYVPDTLQNDDGIVLAVVLLADCASDSEGRLWASCGMPAIADFELLPHRWSTSQLQLLGDIEFAASAAAQQAKLRTQADQIKSCLSAAAAKGDARAAAILREWQWERFLWAHDCVTTRIMLRSDTLELDGLFSSMLSQTASACTSASPHALVPVVDMLNHAASGTVLDVEWIPADAAGRGAVCEVRCARAYAAGEELFISYGDLCAQQLLETYGFLIPWGSNPSEGVHISIRHLVDVACRGLAVPRCAGLEYIPDGKELAARRMARLTAAGCIDDTAFLPAGFRGPTLAAYEECDGVDVEALRCLRLLVADSDEMESLARKGAHALERPLSRHNELRVLKLLQAVIVEEVIRGHSGRLASTCRILDVVCFVTASAAAQASQLLTMSEEGAGACPPEVPTAVWKASAEYNRIRLHVFSRHLGHIARMLTVAGELTSAAETAAPLTCKFALEVQRPWSDLLLNGKKTIETRAYELSADMLGERIALIESPQGGLASNGMDSGALVGIVVFSACRLYSNKQEWVADAAAHCVDVDASSQAFGWSDEQPKYGWKVSTVTAVPVTRLLLSEQQRIHRSLFTLKRDE